MTFAVGFLIGVAVVRLAIWIGRWRRHRKEQTPVSPSWLNENAYRRGQHGDERRSE